MNNDANEDATKLPVLRAAIDEGLAELDAGLEVEQTPDEIVDEISAELGLDRVCVRGTMP